MGDDKTGPIALAAPRAATVRRDTRETHIELALALDGSGKVEVDTGLGFFDHMLTALCFHARFDVTLRCKGDLEVDDHHTIEDVALALGSALDQALGSRADIARFAHAYAPLDEALARAVIDFSGRPSAHVALGFQREAIGPVATENLTHFFRSLATTARMTLHVTMLAGENDHHRAEAAFKATALALRQAVRLDARRGSEGGDVPSTKGSLGE
ncbi:MAG: imidazoleglycerol-phosphate dehydratase HisB [Myxococcales bacterium]|nr:imidazoleglycerol-phosphate dehydratase HisB [Myxococcales bacterium]